MKRAEVHHARRRGFRCPGPPCLRYATGVVLLGYLALGFKLWMIADAMRRRVKLVWWLILLLPLGEWAYFFSVKLRDFNVRPGEAPRVDTEANTEPTLEDLRRAEAESPSFHHRFRLAVALAAAGSHAEASGLFEKCLRTHPKDRDAQYGLGLARLDAGDCAGGIEALSVLVERTMGYDDYRAATRLAEALFEDDRRDDAFALLDEIARQGRKLEHQVAIARYQMRADLRADARTTLERALASFEAQPDDVRPRSGAVATEARRLLRTLDQEPS